MTDLTVTLDSDTYEAMIAHSKHDFAVIEPLVEGSTRHHVLKLHARAMYIMNLVDTENGIVRTDDGTPKPTDPHP